MDQYDTPLERVTYAFSSENPDNLLRRGTVSCGVIIVIAFLLVIGLLLLCLPAFGRLATLSLGREGCETYSNCTCNINGAKTVVARAPFERYMECLLQGGLVVFVCIISPVIIAFAIIAVVWWCFSVGCRQFSVELQSAFRGKKTRAHYQEITEAANVVDQ